MPYLKPAELARDAAKKAGRNQVKVYKYDNSELTERKEQMQWVGRIQKAMRDNRFEIYCQEIRPAAASAEKYHFEILVRMTGEEGEIIPPNDFIPTAERYNLMPALDRWVIDTYLRTAAGQRPGTTSARRCGFHQSVRPVAGGRGTGWLYR